MESVVQKPMYRFLMVLTICSAVGLQSWRTLFDNFAVEVGLGGWHVGVLQSIREIPGFMTFLVIYVLFVMKEHRLSAISILFLGAGVSFAGFFPSFGGLIFTTLLMSIGFHYYETTNQSLTLQYFSKDESPWVLGKLRSIASASNICVGILIFVLAFFLDFKGLYILFGVAIAVAGMWAFTQNPEDRSLPPQHRRMIFRRKYSLFYFLTFMAGARRQIFIAFAVFLMVQRFGFTVQEITILFVINNLVVYFVSPYIGKAIIRFGERSVLTLEYGSLIFIFYAYAMTESKVMVAVLYVLDHVVFYFAIAIHTYFQKVAEPEEIAPSMAVSFTINHIAAVVLPVIGGSLWLIDYRIPFFCGAVMSFISLVAVQWIPAHVRSVAATA